jgi:hypothetical protein
MPLVFVLFTVLILMAWLVAARTSRLMLEMIMANPAEIVKKSVPIFGIWSEIPVFDGSG